jgi:serpin B
MKKIILHTVFLLISINIYSQDVSNSQKFAFSMFKNLAQGEVENVFLSPYSIRTILGLCAEGATGETLKEMENTLFLEKDPTKRQLHTQQVIQKISDAQDFKLLTTNMLWIEKGLKLLESYQKIAKNYYFAGAESVRFSGNAEKARETINKFVAQKTNQMIKNLIPSGAIGQDTKLVLTNTIYFKADWANAFDKNNTKKDNFKINGEKDEKVDFMYQKANFRAGIAEGNTLIQLPYKGDKVSMWVVLPKDKKLSVLLENLGAEQWVKMKTVVQRQEVMLYLPKFEFESKYMLSKKLKEMGMLAAFTDGAQFPEISKQASLKISEVIHQAKVKVEEKGTEAAAATAVVMKVTSSMERPEIKPPFVFKADHPFLFVIEHNETQEILFVGTVQNPKK